jgi:formylglycine-generating enzyme required for sulfatase activity
LDDGERCLLRIQKAREMNTSTSQIFVPIKASHLLLAIGCVIVSGSLVASGEEPKFSLFEGRKAGEEKTSASGMKFCWIPQGKFTMGSPESEEERNEREDQVDVTITKGFWMGKYEVTQVEWTSIMGSTLMEQQDKAGRTPTDPGPSAGREPRR